MNLGFSFPSSHALFPYTATYAALPFPRSIDNRITITSQRLTIRTEWGEFSVINLNNDYFHFY